MSDREIGSEVSLAERISRDVSFVFKTIQTSTRHSEWVP